MSLFLKPKLSSPIQLLLWLEWILLAVTASVQIVIAIAKYPIGQPAFNLLILGIFTTMRWYFPERWIYKSLYTIAEFILLLILTFATKNPSPALLYVVLTIRNCVLFSRHKPLEATTRSIVTFLSFIICLSSPTYRLMQGRLIVHIPQEQLGSVWIAFAISFSLVFVFLQLLVDAVLAEREGQQQIVAANAKLRQYALQVEELATMRERNRIARDIHDSLGHSLTAFNIHIGAALRLLKAEPAEAESLLCEAKDLGARALQEVRASVSLLRADPLQNRSLDEAIASLLVEFHRTTGITPDFKYQIERLAVCDSNRTLAIEINFTLYRIVQESLTNICKHAQATAVAIEIYQTPTTIIASIWDNGCGFDLCANPSGFGLQGMQERTLALGGEFQIETALDRGCQIRVILTI